MFFSCFFKLSTIKIDQATYIKNLFKVYGKANKENKVKFGFNQPSTQAFSSRSHDMARNFVTSPHQVESNEWEERAWILGWVLTI